jgi:MFS family permease
MSRYVDRFGRTGFAALTSLIWFLPMAAWAGSSDLSPIDKTAYPWVALSIGIVMFAVWLFLLTRLGKIPVSTRQRRLDLAQMSKSEKRWTLALVAFGAGLIAWLNAAATVDWAPLGGALKSGSSGALVFAGALAAYLLVMIAGVLISWLKARQAFKRRKSAATTLE